MTKKLVLSALAALMVLMLLAGCGQQAPTEGDSGESGTAPGTSNEVSSVAYLTNFTAATMSGEDFTQANFQDYDLTMINVWTTWCGFCLEEMPELQKLYTQLPENVNLISICDDAQDEKDLAQEIITENGVTFPVLIGDAKLNDSLAVTAVPTTLFVDSQGNQIGEAQLGVPSSEDGDVVKAYQNLIEANLAKVNSN